MKILDKSNEIFIFIAILSLHYFLFILLSNGIKRSYCICFKIVFLNPTKLSRRFTPVMIYIYILWKKKNFVGIILSSLTLAFFSDNFRSSKQNISLSVLAQLIGIS